jgi:uncharacterized membrane protein YeaQ/YmgE (transglycosylase-associated protein family)
VTDAILHRLGIIPPSGTPASNGVLALATVYRTVYGVIGSYVTARLAPNRPMLHAMIPGALGFIVSIVGAAVTWNHSEFGPHWYPVLLIILALPTAWLGGKLYEQSPGTS